MKKLLSLILTAVMALSLCACASGTGGGADTTAAPSGGAIKAGFGRGDITPTESVPLSGYGDSTSRMSTGILSYIYADAIAIQDENGNTGIIITVDAGSMSDKVCSTVAAQIESKTGVPKESIFVSCNHLHSVPDAAAQSAESGRYAALKEKGMVEAGVKAFEDLAPAEVYMAQVKTENMVFVRHYEMNDGSWFGDNYGTSASGFKAHESDADPMLRLIKFVREGQTTASGKKAKDIIFAGFQGHPHRDVSDESMFYTVTANLPGVFRDTLAKELDCHVAYFTGASGNLNQISKIEKENVTADYKEQGRKLAEYALGAEGQYEKISGGEVKVINRRVEYNTNKVGQDRISDANTVVNYWLENSDKAGATQMAKEMGFHSVYECQAIIGRAGMDDTKSMTIGAMAVGDMAFFYCPYEIFDTNAMAVQKASPFKITACLYLCNGANGYLPSALTVSHGNYPVDITFFEYGTAEKLEADYIDILNELAKK